MAIDWEFIIDGYNNQHASNLTEQQVLQHCYDSIGSVQRVANYLGVGYLTLAKRMDKLHIARPQRGEWPSRIAKRIMAIPAIRMRDMTAYQIAKEINCHHDSVYNNCEKLGRVYKKVGKGNGRRGER